MRGVALLGILVINMATFAFPDAAIFNPMIIGGFSGLNLLTWKISYFLFMQKAYAIFAMLFGAGAVLMYQRAQEKGSRLGGTFYLRLLWLFVFGMLHAYFLWFGDILVAYAMCGLLLFPLRRLKARNLLIVGSLVYLLGVPIQFGASALMTWMRDTATEVETLRSEGQEPTQMQLELAQGWEQMKAYYDPPPGELERQIAIHRGDYWAIAEYRAPMVLILQTQAFIGMILWRTLGLMLLGMGLMKFRFFAAQLSLRFYTYFGTACYVVGLLLVGLGIDRLTLHHFDIIAKTGGDGLLNYVGSPLVALGHVSVVMVCCKLGLVRRLKDSFAAVGRMAFSNYIFHSLVFTTIFYGYGLGLFAKVDRATLWLFILPMWALQLWLSPLWLSRFRYGPLEWLWRTLTYRKRQPFRLQ